jgi:hypothetical protein
MDCDSFLSNTKAVIHGLKTEYTEAQHIQEGILHRTSAVLSPVPYALALVNIVSIDLLTGTSTDSVSPSLDTAAAIFQNAHDTQGISICEVHYADLKFHKGDTGGACAQYMQVFIAAYGKDNELTCACLMRLADPIHPVHAASEIARWAIIFLAYTMRRSARGTLEVHRALRCFGDVLAQQGMDEEAHSILTVALEGFTWMDVHQGRAECMQTLGDIHFHRGELSKAWTLWREARPLFQRSLQAKAVAGIDIRLAGPGETLSKLDVPIAPFQQLSIALESEPVHDNEDN